MPVIDDRGAAPAPAGGAIPSAVVVGDDRALPRVDDVLGRLLAHSQTLLGTVAGSISLVDPARGRYDKRAELGIPCRVGQSFPLDEGATGQAVTRRMPVVIDDYSLLKGGHLPGTHPASRGAVAAVPLWWRDQIIGVNVVFAGNSRRFTVDEVDSLEVLTQSAAPAVVQAGRAVPSLAGLLREHGRVFAKETGVQTLVTEVGSARPVPDAVSSAAADLVAAVRRMAASRSGDARLHVAVVHRPMGLRLLVQDEVAEAVPGLLEWPGRGPIDWSIRAAADADALGGAVDIEHIAGWGTVVRADYPTRLAQQTGAGEPSPLTGREHEVLVLLARGLSDREVAARLQISPRTVEKHVGAAMRKTGRPSRTSAVVHAMEHGWLDPS